MFKKNSYEYTVITLMVISISILITYTIPASAQDQNNTIITPQDQNNTISSISGQNDTLVATPSKFNPVPFDRIPLAIINTQSENYEFRADYSLDFGDLTVIEHDDNALSATNMILDKNDNSLSLELQCDSNDRCGTGLAPESVRIYLTDASTQDIHIAENSVPKLVLESNTCRSNQAIEDCANFSFSIPGNIVLQEYKIVVEMNFDEAKWIFINHVEIVDSINSNNNVQVRCDDLAIALITWDQLLSIVPDGDTEGKIAENEHELNENGVEPDLYNDIIDQNLDRLLDKVKTDCKNLDTGMETMINEIEFILPF